MPNQTRTPLIALWPTEGIFLITCSRINEYQILLAMENDMGIRLAYQREIQWLQGSISHLLS